MTAEKAEMLLREYIESFLSSTRPLNKAQYQLVLAFVEDYDIEIKTCPCKDTAVKLLLDTRNPAYASLLSLPDVIRLVEQLQYQDYGSTDIRKLNLNNRDRKLIRGVLDTLFTAGHCDTRSCFEKKRLWCGLLHHIHYKPVNQAAEVFVKSMRGKKNRSVYAAYERCLADGDIQGAADALAKGKGGGAVLRHLDELLVHCHNDQQLEAVIRAARSENIMILIQLLMRYSCTANNGARTFRFARFNKLVKHRETGSEMSGSFTRHLADHVDLKAVQAHIRKNLEEVCRGKLGKVYVDESMKRMALPLQETASMSGMGTLPKGCRLLIPSGKIIRGFTYWEKVDDIDLSVIALTDNGEQIEFSWRSMGGRQSDGVAYSGDQTSGYNGGSEFFDINVEEIIKIYPSLQYLVFCNNVFSGIAFDKCMCKAGYMLREKIGSGEIFEPKTVASSFRINCDSTFAYLFAIDVRSNEFVWLNIANDSQQRIAGTSSIDFLKNVLNSAKVLSVYDFASMLATQVVHTSEEADVVFSDEELTLQDDAEQICSCDYEKILALLNL